MYHINWITVFFQISLQAKERVIRSQFSCTYSDEEPPLNRVLEFPSTSQVPTCVHPAPRRNDNISAAADEGHDGDTEEPNAGTAWTFDRS